MTWSLWGAYQAASSAAAGAAAMASDLGSLDTSSLDGVQADLDDAIGHLRRPWVAPVRLVPWVGRQLNATEKIAEAGREVVDVGADALIAIDSASFDDPVGALAVVSAELQRASERLDSLAVPSGKWLAGPIADARVDLVENLLRVTDQIARYEALVSGLSELAASDPVLLVAAANTSEMGSASGMLLQYGVLRLHNGSVEVSDFDAVTKLERPSLVPIDDEARLLWAAFDPGHIWQYTSHLSSRASEVSRITADMWLSAQGQRVDGVIIISPKAMRLLLEAAGIDSVQVAGTELSTSELVQYFAYDQYVDFDAGTEGIEQRREAIAPVAAAAFEAIFDSDVDAGALAEAMFAAFDGRHMFLWSRSDVLQSRWQAAGASGDPAPDSLKVALLNAGGNKLDRFIEVSSTVQTRAQPAGDGEGMTERVEVEIRNVATAGLPDYVAGTKSPGRYIGNLVVSLPRFVTPLDSGGTTELNAAGPDGDLQVLVFNVELDPGQSAKFFLEFSVPAEVSSLTIEPSGRFPSIEWTVDGQSRPDVRTTIDLG